MIFRRKQSWFLGKKKHSCWISVAESAITEAGKSVTPLTCNTPISPPFLPRSTSQTHPRRRYLHLCCPLLPVSGRASCNEGVAVVDAAHFLLRDDVKHTILHLVALVSTWDNDNSSVWNSHSNGESSSARARFVTRSTGQSAAGLQQTTERRPRCAANDFLLRVALDHCAMLVVAVQAAALPVAALLGAHCVTAAVVAEGTPTQPGNETLCDVSKTRSCGFICQEKQRGKKK